MTLPPTARLANIKDSVKKFAKDKLQEDGGIYVTFDVTLVPPRVDGQAVTRWISIRIGDRAMSSAGFQVVEFYCCTVRDSEGYLLAQLRDTVMGFLTGGGSDIYGRIPLYRSYPSQPWEQIGALVVQNVAESGELDGPDLTKYIVLTATLWFGAGV
jgi:hypothetical protein